MMLHFLIKLIYFFICLGSNSIIIFLVILTNVSCIIKKFYVQDNKYVYIHILKKIDSNSQYYSRLKHKKDLHHKIEIREYVIYNLIANLLVNTFFPSCKKKQKKIQVPSQIYNDLRLLFYNDYME